MSQPNKRQIEWFLNFMDMDFDSDFFEDKLYLLKDMPITFGGFLHPDLSSLKQTIWDSDINEAELIDKEETLKRLQGKLKQFVNALKQRFAEIQQCQEKNKNLLKKVRLKDLDDLRVLGQIEIDADVKVIIRHKPKVERQPENRGSLRAYWPDNTLEKSPLEVAVIPKGGDEDFLFLFAKAIEGIPLTALRQCSECGKWILQSGKRERLFCSNQCRARRANREMRERIKEEGGEAYRSALESGAERARASHERRLKEKHGPNVKVGRRKIKRKGEED